MLVQLARAIEILGVPTKTNIPGLNLGEIGGDEVCETGIEKTLGVKEGAKAVFDEDVDDHEAGGVFDTTDGGKTATEEQDALDRGQVLLSDGTVVETFLAGGGDGYGEEKVFGSGAGLVGEAGVHGPVDQVASCQYGQLAVLFAGLEADDLGLDDQQQPHGGDGIGADDAEGAITSDL